MNNDKHSRNIINGVELSDFGYLLYRELSLDEVLAEMRPSRHSRALKGREQVCDQFGISESERIHQLTLVAALNRAEGETETPIDETDCIAYKAYLLSTEQKRLVLPEPAEANNYDNDRCTRFVFKDGSELSCHIRHDGFQCFWSHHG